MRKVDPAKHEEKRRDILRAAERCFVRDGFRGASISEICAEAGISPGHLYHYFASKEAIIGAMTQTGLEYASVRFHEMAESSNPVAALLAEIGRAKPGEERNWQCIMLEMLSEAMRNPAVAQIVTRNTLVLRTMLTNFLREAQSRGQVDPSIDAELTAAVLLSVMDGAKTLTIRDPSLNLPGALEVLRTMIGRLLSPT
ncbi:TetR/AcrR family transcriptional regulator [Acidisphaera sp. L21]|uniref:TetR/AcrR family transcriptional regulator n=1 Tax=Acidisphaera sp. L21 TaxID=1641851 RepID=UPI00131C6689|nr:TetR/AcrR family transcriptional regulator [Acidisphaera sp. L21]